METKTHYTREEAATLLRCSTRTLDRWIPVGTPGRTGGGDGPNPYPVQIARHLVEALLPAPGGDDHAE